MAYNPRVGNITLGPAPRTPANMSGMFLDGDAIPDELIPYKEKLGPRFFEVRAADASVM